MKRSILAGIGVTMIAAIAVSAYIVRNRIISAATEDVPDRDFIATISPTGIPQVVDLEVRKINRSAQKQIKGWPVMVDFIIQDSAGREYRSDHIGQAKYAKEIGGPAFTIGRLPADSVHGRARILLGDAKPGEFEITPVVRIIEVGKDSISGPYADGGSVAVPSGNSITMTLK